jgi:hypothetical protein
MVGEFGFVRRALHALMMVIPCMMVIVKGGMERRNTTPLLQNVTSC